MKKPKNVLAFFAHPDDETMLAGGTLALLAKAGADVHYLIATRGEGGEMGEPALCTREELGKVREKELACAVEMLGGASLTILDYVDPVVGEDNELYAYADDAAFVAAEVAEIIRSKRIDAVISHGSNGEYGHPAHLFTHQAARKAVELVAEGGLDLSFYTANACFPEHPKPRLANKDDPADLVIDIRPVLEAKIAAALCHKTQQALFVRRASKEQGRQMAVPEVIVSLESLHRVYPEVVETGQDGLIELLKPWEWKQGA